MLVTTTTDINKRNWSLKDKLRDLISILQLKYSPHPARPKPIMTCMAGIRGHSFDIPPTFFAFYRDSSRGVDVLRRSIMNILIFNAPVAASKDVDLFIPWPGFPSQRGVYGLAGKVVSRPLSYSEKALLVQ